MSLGVEFAPAAARQVRALPAEVRAQVLADVATLADEPVGPPPRIKRLQGMRPTTYRLRSGAYRVVYRLTPPCVVVLAVVDRKYVLMSYGSLLWAMGRMEEVGGSLPRSLVEHTETADMQTTAYAALGLGLGPVDGARAADAARGWLGEAAFADDSTFVGGVAWAPSHRRSDARPELPFEVEPEVVAEALTALLAE